MSKVYVVTSGCYSDYHIVCIFDSKENAQDYINKKTLFDSSDDYGIEEYELNKTDDIETCRFCYVVNTGEVFPEGSFTRVYEEPSYALEANSINSLAYSVHRKTGVFFNSYDSYKNYIKEHVYSKKEIEKRINFISNDFCKGVYIVDVTYHDNMDAMKKSVFDKVAAYKEAIKDFPEGWEHKVTSIPLDF